MVNNNIASNIDLRRKKYLKNGFQKRLFIIFLLMFFIFHLSGCSPDVKPNVIKSDTRNSQYKVKKKSKKDSHQSILKNWLKKTNLKGNKKKQNTSKKYDHTVVKNHLKWEWPVKGILLKKFDKSSNGIDISGKFNTKVKAASSGIVVYSGHALKGFGNFIIIKHDQDFLSAYAHNEQLLVNEGDQVKKGQEIALMGHSDALQVKLHFEIRHKGRAVDPLKYLPK